MISISADEATAAWQRLGTTVRAVLRRKSGMSLREDDARHDNVEALDLYQEVMARLWERLAGGDDPADLPAYAATVAHNAWSDHLRRRHPLRASLKNRLRYFLGHQPRYALWNGPGGDLLTGLHGWQLAPPAPGGADVLAALRTGQARLPRGSVPRQPLERFEAADWDRLLGALYAHAGRPVELDELVAVVAALIGLKEERVESIDAWAEADEPTELPDAATPGPEQVAEVRGLLRQLWGAIGALKWDYRCAYLLNLPGPGKVRAELEVFVLHGVASLADIEAVLALREAHYRAAFAALAIVPALAPLADAAPPPERQRHFAVLWPHLPLADAVIGRMLGYEPQQVINRRMLALRELARLMGHELRRGKAGPRP